MHLMVQFKSFKAKERSKLLHPLLLGIIDDMCDWVTKRGKEFTITESVTTLQEDQALNRVSASHREGRAIDLSTHGWGMELIQDFQTVFNIKYQSVAAQTKSGDKVLVVYHDSGHGPHMHIQIHSKFANDAKNSLKS